MLLQDPELKLHIARCFKHYPKVKEFLEQRQAEQLRKLPSVLANTQLAQGRCQELGDLLRLIEESTEYAAKNPNN